MVGRSLALLARWRRLPCFMLVRLGDGDHVGILPEVAVEEGSVLLERREMDQRLGHTTVRVGAEDPRGVRHKVGIAFGREHVVEFVVIGGLLRAEHSAVHLSGSLPQIVEAADRVHASEQPLLTVIKIADELALR